MKRHVLLLLALAIYGFAAWTAPQYADVSWTTSHVQPLSHHLLNSEQWSEHSLVLRGSKDKIHRLHNYTIDHSTQLSRWTSREVELDHALQRRALGIDNVATNQQLWKYRPGLRRDRPLYSFPVAVFLCFRDEEAKQKLQKAVREAMCRWDLALRPSRQGVMFQFLSNQGQNTAQADLICPEKGTQRRKLYLPVEIQYWSPNYGNGSTGRGPDPWFSIGDEPFPMEDDYTQLSAITKGLGRILGLRNENQRPDALQHTDFNCVNVRRYAAFRAKILRDPERHKWLGGLKAGQSLTMADFGTIGQLSYVPPYIHWWWGYKFVPFSDQYKRTEVLANGNPININAGLPRQYGTFDTSSIMFMCGENGYNGDLEALTISDFFGNIIPCPKPDMKPSAGDIAAINAMYPPQGTPMGPPPPPPPPRLPPRPLPPNQGGSTSNQGGSQGGPSNWVGSSQAGPSNPGGQPMSPQQLEEEAMSPDGMSSPRQQAGDIIPGFGVP